MSYYTSSFDLIIQFVHAWTRLIATKWVLVRVYQLVVFMVPNDERRCAHAANQLLCLLMLQNVAHNIVVMLKEKILFLHCCLLHQPLRKGAADASNHHLKLC